MSFAPIDPVFGVLSILIVVGGCLGVIGFFRNKIDGMLARLAGGLRPAPIGVSRAAATDQPSALMIVLRDDDSNWNEVVAIDEPSVLPIRRLNDIASEQSTSGQGGYGRKAA